MHRVNRKEIFVDLETEGLEAYRANSGVVVYARGLSGVVFVPETPKDADILAQVKVVRSRNEKATIKDIPAFVEEA